MDFYISNLQGASYPEWSNDILKSDKIFWRLFFIKELFDGIGSLEWVPLTCKYSRNVWDVSQLKIGNEHSL